jgi:predicted ATP-grasp superfamily ATP-dependent carboligase
MRAVAEAVGRAVPGLRGYVGIDLIDTVAGAVVIEINPRLTTAYVGLRESLSRNPAALMLEAFGDEPITPPDLEPAKAVRVDMK